MCFLTLRKAFSHLVVPSKVTRWKGANNSIVHINYKDNLHDTTISKICLDLETYKSFIRQFQASFILLCYYLLDTECFNLEAKTCRDNQKTAAGLKQ